MEKSEIHSLELSFEDMLGDEWEQIYLDWQDDAVEQLKTKYGDRVETITVFAVDTDSEPPSKTFNVQADLETPDTSGDDLDDIND